MNRAKSASRLLEVMRDVFDDDDIEYDNALTAGRIAGWDRLSHLRFLRAVEKEFGLDFTSREVDSLQSAGDILDAILMRTMTV